MPEKIYVALIHVQEVVLYKLETRLDWLIENPIIYSHGRTWDICCRNH